MVSTGVLWHARRIMKRSSNGPGKPLHPAPDELLVVSLIEWQRLPRYLALCHRWRECFCGLLVRRRESKWIYRAYSSNQRHYHDSCFEPAIDTLFVSITKPQRVT